MKSDIVKLAEIKQRQDLARALVDFVSSPIVAGFSALMANHAIYKSGFYKPDAEVVDVKLLGWDVSRVDKDQAAISVHDSIALFIMIASVAYAMNYRKPVTESSTVVGTVKDTLAGVPKLVEAGV